jgi:hypothetical protein
MAKTKTDLEDQLKERDRRIADLKRELDEARDLVQRQNEQLQDVERLIESWKEAFDMTLDENGMLSYAPWFKACEDYRDHYNALLREWNKYVALFNASGLGRNVGRPLKADDGQVKRIRQLDRKGMSLRAIAEEVGIGLQTVRTILDGDVGLDRPTRNRLERIAPDHLQERLWQRRREGRRSLPRRIGVVEKTNAELRKEAKGLGRS